MADYRDEGHKKGILDLETTKKKILREREDTRRLKTRVVWLRKGDDNSKFFHNYIKHRNNTNSIHSLEDEEGALFIRLSPLVDLGVRHFSTLFKEETRAFVTDMVRMSLFFPSSIGEESNVLLMEETSMEELKKVLMLLQKGKSSDPNGWIVEFFIFFLISLINIC